MLDAAIFDTRLSLAAPLLYLRPTPHADPASPFVVRTCIPFLSVPTPTLTLTPRLQDAYMLGHLLSHPHTTAANVHVALAVYDAVRRPIANQCVADSLRLRCLYELTPGWLPAGVDAERARAGALKGELEALWAGSTGAAYALHEAVKVLRETVGESNFMRWAPFVHYGV